MPLSLSFRLNTFSALALLPVAALTCTLVLTGCDNQARAVRSINQALAAALTDYDSATNATLGATVSTPSDAQWADVQLLAARQAQYDSLIPRFKEISTNTSATSGQKVIALSTLANIMASRARFLVRHADLDRATHLRLCTNLHGTLGVIESQAMSKQPALAQSIVALLEKGESDGHKTTSLTELNAAKEKLVKEIDATKAKLKAVETAKNDLRAQADESFAKVQTLNDTLLHTQGKERFELMDQASMARRDGEIAQATLVEQDQELETQNSHLRLLASNQVALDQMIGVLEERLKAAKSNSKASGDVSSKTDASIAQLHDQWIAKAKELDTQFSERIDTPLIQAVTAFEEAQSQLDSAAKAAGGQKELLPSLVMEKAGLATGLAQAQVLRLRALDAYKATLSSLTAREQVLTNGKTDLSFSQTRVNELTTSEVSASAAALDACKNALTTLDESTPAEDVKELKATVLSYMKSVTLIKNGLGLAAPEAVSTAPMTIPAVAPATDAPKK